MTLNILQIVVGIGDGWVTYDHRRGRYRVITVSFYRDLLQVAGDPCSTGNDPK